MFGNESHSFVTYTSCSLPAVCPTHTLLVSVMREMVNWGVEFGLHLSLESHLFLLVLWLQLNSTGSLPPTFIPDVTRERERDKEWGTQGERKYVSVFGLKEKESKYTAEGTRHQNFSKLQLCPGRGVHIKTNTIAIWTNPWPIQLFTKEYPPRLVGKTCLWGHFCKMILSDFLHVSWHFPSEMSSEWR